MSEVGGGVTEVGVTVGGVGGVAVVGVGVGERDEGGNG